MRMLLATLTLICLVGCSSEPAGPHSDAEIKSRVAAFERQGGKFKLNEFGDPVQFIIAGSITDRDLKNIHGLNTLTEIQVFSSGKVTDAALVYFKDLNNLTWLN